MKKISFLIAAALAAAALYVAVLPASAYNIPCDIVITECFSNPNTVAYEGGSDTKDYVEYMEIMNVSNHDVDLYDYTFHYLTDTTAEGVQAKADAGTAGKSETFSDVQGQCVLTPGQTALVWFVTSEVWQNEAKHKLMAIGTNNQPEYYTEKYWAALRDFAVNTCQMLGIPDTINGTIVVYDLSNEHGTGDTHFNLANPSATKACGYYICPRGAEVGSYLTGVIVPATATSADTGFAYDLSDGKMLTLSDSTPLEVTPGTLHPSQVNLAAQLGVTFETTTVTTTQTPTTTTDNPAATTSPTTSAPVTTSTPVTTKTPTTTATPAQKNCRSIIGAAPLLLMAASAVIFRKKKK